MLYHLPTSEGAAPSETASLIPKTSDSVSFDWGSDSPLGVGGGIGVTYILTYQESFKLVTRTAPPC